MKDKFILDACCGPRMFWFNKQHPNCIYIDKRVEEKGFVISRDKREVKPDIVMNFKNMTFPDKSFKLIVWDPPHLIHKEAKSIMGKSYGVLNPETWQYDLKKGFEECWRVLEDYGVLIFKFNSHHISFKKVLKQFPIEPLFGQKTVSKTTSETKWFTFMKIPN